MTDTSKKPREFRLEVGGFSTSAFSWDQVNPNHLEHHEEIHVIEYSAYQASIESTRAIEKLYFSQVEQNKALKEQADKLEKALEKIKNRGCTPEREFCDACTSADAVADYKKWKDGI